MMAVSEASLIDWVTAMHAPAQPDTNREPFYDAENPL